MFVYFLTYQYTDYLKLRDDLIFKNRNIFLQ